MVPLTARNAAPVLLRPSSRRPPPNANPRGGASSEGLAIKPEGAGAGDDSDPSSLVSVKVGESSRVRVVLRPLGCLSMGARRISLKA
jgi:hypothetical protein